MAEEYGLSMNALVDIYAYSTIRIRGSYQERRIVILINSDNTYNFINVQIIKEIKTIVEKITTLAIIISNESVIRCNSYRLKLIWICMDIVFKQI